MDALAIGQENAVVISVDTEELIKAACRITHSKRIEGRLELNAWVYAMKRADSEPLKDAVLAEYITQLHRSGKAPSTIAQVLAAVKWQAKNIDRPDVRRGNHLADTGGDTARWQGTRSRSSGWVDMEGCGASLQFRRSVSDVGGAEGFCTD